MNARLPCAALLLCFALTAQAEVTVYRFIGYFSAEKQGTDAAAQFAQSVSVPLPFTGTVWYDPDRRLTDPETLQEYAAPIVDVEVIPSFQMQPRIGLAANNDSRVSVIRSAGIETLRLQSSGTIEVSSMPSNGDFFFSWSSSEAGQLPADPTNASSIDLAQLQPNKWTLEIINRGECVLQCDPHSVSSFKGHITDLWEEGPSSPTNYQEGFDATPDGWTNEGGEWIAEGGVYRNVANTAFTSSVYEDFELKGRYFSFIVGMYSEWGNSGNTFGVVLFYRDPDNFDEIRFNPLGTVSYNRIRNGIRTMVQTARYTLPGKRRWFNAYVNRSRDELTLSLWNELHSENIFTIDVSAMRGGSPGFFSSWNRARFDNLQLFQDPNWELSYSNEFRASGPAEGWTITSGTWTVIDGNGPGDRSGYYYSSSNLPAAISTTGEIPQNEYSIDSSVFLEWSKSGNRGGIVYDYQDAQNYRAILIAAGTRVNGVSTRGTLEVIELRNGIRRVVHRSNTAAGPWVLSKQWTPLGVRRLGEMTEITAADLRLVLSQPIVAGVKRVGVIASYNEVRFDDVVVAVP